MSPTSYQTAPPRVGGEPSYHRSTRCPTGTVTLRGVRWRRKRREPAAPPSTELALTPKVERALVALVVHAQQIEGRLDRLERRIDEVAEEGLDAPSHNDLLEVRLHSAKVAAELARVTVELKGEIEEAVVRATEPSPEELRLRTFAESVLELSDRLDTIPRDQGNRGAA